MYWRNMKLKIIIGLIILAGLLYIIVPIIIKVSASNWNLKNNNFDNFYKILFKYIYIYYIFILEITQCYIQ